MDEMYDMLYSLVNALTARGFGFNACYMKDGFNSTRIETDNDINGMFAQFIRSDHMIMKFMCR